MKDKPDSLHALLLETRSLLAFHQQCDFDYPLTEELKTFLQTKAQLKKSPQGRRPSTTFQPPKKQRSSPPKKPQKVQKATDITISDLKKELAECHCCGLSKTQKLKILGEGKEISGLPLFIVCDAQEENDKNNQQSITGEPRELLIKMLSAIKLSLRDVYLTNSIKCQCSGQSASGADISTCFTFLQRQIEILKPQIICTMGPNATQTMLKTKTTLSSQRGKFHSFLDIPLIATFHPALLIKHPDMKKGSWNDLQMIQKKLAEIGVS